jgi:hypothetical protein
MEPFSSSPIIVKSISIFYLNSIYSNIMYPLDSPNRHTHFWLNFLYLSVPACHFLWLCICLGSWHDNIGLQCTDLQYAYLGAYSLSAVLLWSFGLSYFYHPDVKNKIFKLHTIHLLAATITFIVALSTDPAACHWSLFTQGLFAIVFWLFFYTGMCLGFTRLGKIYNFTSDGYEEVNPYQKL